MYAIISSHTPNYKLLADVTWTNKEEYAERHGYLTHCKTEGHDPNLQWSYDKLYFIKDIMERLSCSIDIFHNFGSNRYILHKHCNSR